MNYIKAFLLLLLISSCQITETININPDGSGNIEVVELRDENSHMQAVGEAYSREDIFEDTTYIFNDYITKYKEIFLKYTPVEQQLFRKYSNVKVHVKKSSFEKEFRNTYTQDFNKVSDIPNLYKTQLYASDLKNNHALTAEKHYYKIEYSFDGAVFKRLVAITDQEQLQKERDRFKKIDSRYASLKPVQSYILQYHFPKKIKSVSNEKVIISSDKKALTLEFQLSECLQNPEMTSLEVVLE